MCRVIIECNVSGAQVVRKVGCKGAVSIAWATRDGTAVAPNDYTASSGTLHFAPGATAEWISVPIRDDGRFDMDEEFEVILSRPRGGARISGGANGAPDRAIATVRIVSDDARKDLVDDVAEMLELNVDNIEIAAHTWAAQA